MALTATMLPFMGLWHLLYIIPVSILLYKILTFGRREKHLPPGPPTLPIVGNAHQIPSKGLYTLFRKWADQYGGVFSLKVGQGTMIVLSDRRAVHELLSKQGAYFNDRPHDRQVFLAMGNENPAFIYDSPEWRAERKISASFFTPKRFDSDQIGIQDAEVGKFLFDLLEKPLEHRAAIKRTTASMGSVMLFGHHARDADSFWAHPVYTNMEILSETLDPGSYLPVEQFPILKLIPYSWTASNRRAKECYRILTDTWCEAVRRVEKRRSSGDKRDSLMDSLLDEEIKCDVPLSPAAFANFFGGVFMGTADTTATTMLTDVLFLAKHPEVQEKAQIELDRVCGSTRLPRWSDFKDLPYVNCILKEGLRIKPIIPTGIPHRAKEDKWFDGMLIPAGSAVFIPAFALNHDSKYVVDPYAYNPDRFLPQAGKLAPELAASSRYEERDHYSYGAGRRMCVGVHMAERTMWRMLAQMLWAFSIEPGVEDDGSTAELIVEYVEGFLLAPKEFNVRFVPRSEERARIVRQNFEESRMFLREWE